MKFEHANKTYLIEFERTKRFVDTYNANDELERKETRYPDTTARLVYVGPNGIDRVMFRTATVSCWHKEPVFSLEKGRVRALRLITKTLSKDMKPKMWKAYHERTGSTK